MMLKMCSLQRMMMKLYFLKMTKTKDTLRQELETDQRSKFFGAYMSKARDRMKINVNGELLRTITG